MKLSKLNSICLVLGLLFCLTSVSAGDGAKVKRARLNTVALTLSDKLWVKTDTARLSVSINATLNNKNLVSMRQSLMKKLNQIAPGDWHITRFDRSQDNSGLAKLYVEAFSRNSQSKLDTVFAKAKLLTKPGERFTVTGIDFSPSDSELDKAKATLREKIYQKVSAELSVLNKQYPKQQFTIHRVMFNDALDQMPQTPGPNRFQALALTRKVAAPAVVTSYEASISALVILAATRQVT